MAAELEPVAAVDLPLAALVQPEVKMEEQDPGELKAGAEGAETGGAALRWSALEKIKQYLQEEPAQCQEIKGQEVKQAMQPPSEVKLPLATPRLAPKHDLPTPETWRRRFRGLRYQEAKAPRDVCSHLWDLCQRWLEPQRRSKEQMLELVVLEQFLAILPQEMQSWEWGCGVETCAEAVTLAEGFQLGQADDKKFQVTVNVKIEEGSSETMQPPGVLQEPVDSWLEQPKAHPVEPPPGVLQEPVDSWLEQPKAHPVEQPPGALQEPVDSWLEQPKAHPVDMSLEEVGQREVPGPPDKPCVPREEPLPHQESGKLPDAIVRLGSCSLLLLCEKRTLPFEPDQSQTSLESAMETETSQASVPLADSADSSLSANTRGPNWDRDELKDLLDIWGQERIQRLLEKGHRNKNTFLYIAEQMRRRGHSRDFKQCRCKLKSLKYEFFRARDANNRAGAKKRTCIFYDELSRILSKEKGYQTTKPFGSIGEQEVLEVLDHREDENSMGSGTPEESLDDSFMPGDHGQGAHNVEMVTIESTPSPPAPADTLQAVQAEPGVRAEDTLRTPTPVPRQHAPLHADEGEGSEDTEDSSDMEEYSHVPTASRAPTTTQTPSRAPDNPGPGSAAACDASLSAGTASVHGRAPERGSHAEPRPPARSGAERMRDHRKRLRQSKEEMLQSLVATAKSRARAEDAWREEVREQHKRGLEMWQRQEATVETLVAAFGRTTDVASQCLDLVAKSAAALEAVEESLGLGSLAPDPQPAACGSRQPALRARRPFLRLRSRPERGGGGQGQDGGLRCKQQGAEEGASSSAPA
ncbi:uncharacterized protein LOC109282512 [Alligator mississippiensis]|nr:uncharacterized protein LOC109282512 [Alligator mississippiensis]